MGLRCKLSGGFGGKNKGTPHTFPRPCQGLPETKIFVNSSFAGLSRLDYIAKISGCKTVMIACINVIFLLDIYQQN